MKANGRGWIALGRAAFLAALAAGAVWAAGRAADRGDAPPKADAGGLEFVPADGAAFVSVRVADLWNNPGLKSARERLAKDEPDFAEHFTKEVGVAPDDLERVTAMSPTLQPLPAWAVFVTTAKPYDDKKVAVAVAPGGKEEKVHGRTLTVGANGRAVAFLSDRTFVLGPEDAVRKVIQGAEGSKEGPLTPALREAAGQHLIVAGLNVEELAKTAPPNPPPPVAAFEPLLKAKDAVLTVDLGDEVKADLKATFEGESDAKHGEESANAALDLARAGMVQALAEADANHMPAEVVGLMKDVQAGLRAAKVERKGSELEATASVKFDPDKTGTALLEAVQKVRETAGRMTSANNLKQLALAMYNYNDTFNHFPAQAICDKNGKLLLSWRVAILPYIEQDALYKEFHLDEPWDSEHNKKLLEQMPKTFAAPEQPGKELEAFETRYQVFFGKGAFFEGKEGVKVTDVTDGTSNTILIVEAAKGVPWTKPEDVPFGEGKLLPKVGGLSEGKFQAAMGDGSVRAFPMTIKEEELRAYVTRNGGEVINPNK